MRSTAWPTGCRWASIRPCSASRTPTRRRFSPLPYRPREGRELYEMADLYVKKVIESAPGVGEVSIGGSAKRAVQINVEAKRLAAYGLSIAQVREALVRQNAEIPGGRVDAGSANWLRTLAASARRGRFST